MADSFGYNRRCRSWIQQSFNHNTGKQLWVNIIGYSYIAKNKQFSQTLEVSVGHGQVFLIFKLNDLHHRGITNFLANNNPVMRFYDSKCLPMIQSNLQN